jgi:L-lactate dehydrogenase complex protein LldG
MADAKQHILSTLEQALKQSVPVPFPDVQHIPASSVLPSLQQQPEQDLAVLFASQFTAMQGQFLFCTNWQECRQQLQILGQRKGISRWHCADDHLVQQLTKQAPWPDGWHPTVSDSHASITGAEYLVARTGSLLLSSTASAGRVPSVYSPIHICIAHSSQLVYDVADALQLMQQRYGQQLPSQITLATGPSRTADIEKTLVTGVHGPKEVFCFFIDEE